MIRGLLAIVVLLIAAAPASAEVVAYRFTGVAAGGGTVAGTFWFDTSLVMQVTPVFAGNEWIFSPGGAGVSWNVGAEIGTIPGGGGFQPVVGLVYCQHLLNSDPA